MNSMFEWQEQYLMSFRDFPLRYEIRDNGGLLKDISQLWLIVYKVPFPHDCVL